MRDFRDRSDDRPPFRGSPPWSGAFEMRIVAEVRGGGDVTVLEIAARVLGSWLASAAGPCKRRRS